MATLQSEQNRDGQRDLGRLGLSLPAHLLGPDAVLLALELGLRWGQGGTGVRATG